jgi:F-box and WD-40 domain protein 1/11
MSLSNTDQSRRRPGLHSQATDHSTFSQLFTTALGSPFLTTPDLPDDAEVIDGLPSFVPYTSTVTRPPSPTPTVDSTTFSFIHHDPDATRTPLKSILPRIWHSISPGMRPNSFLFSPSPSPLPYPSKRKSKLRYSSYSPGSVNYDDLEPLDGEEGELISVDDEACFFFDTVFGARAVTGTGE